MTDAPAPYAPPLDDRHRRRAREMAEAQIPDSIILETLKADVYELWEGENNRAHRELILSQLAEVNAEDAAELTAMRARGRAMLQLALYACAMGYYLNARKERFRPEDHTEGADPQALGYAKVAPVEASAMQYLLRNVLALDDNELTEDAQKEARQLLEGGPERQRAAFLALASHLDVPRRFIAPVAERWGFETASEEAVA